MKNTFLLSLLLASCYGFSQSVVKTINSGGIVAAASSVSVWHITLGGGSFYDFNVVIGGNYYGDNINDGTLDIKWVRHCQP